MRPDLSSHAARLVLRGRLCCVLVFGGLLRGLLRAELCEFGYGSRPTSADAIWRVRGRIPWFGLTILGGEGLDRFADSAGPAGRRKLVWNRQSPVPDEPD